MAAVTLTYWQHYVQERREFETVDEAREWAEDMINSGQISAESIEIDGKIVMVDNHDGHGFVAASGKGRGIL